LVVASPVSAGAKDSARMMWVIRARPRFLREQVRAVVEGC
jgi:hypothetical protein